MNDLTQVIFAVPAHYCLPIINAPISHDSLHYKVPMLIPIDILDRGIPEHTFG